MSTASSESTSAGRVFPVCELFRCPPSDPGDSGSTFGSVTWSFPVVFTSCIVSKDAILSETGCPDVSVVLWQCCCVSCDTVTWFGSQRAPVSGAFVPGEFCRPTYRPPYCISFSWLGISLLVSPGGVWEATLLGKVPDMPSSSGDPPGFRFPEQSAPPSGVTWKCDALPTGGATMTIIWALFSPCWFPVTQRKNLHSVGLLVFIWRVPTSVLESGESVLADSLIVSDPVAIESLLEQCGSKCTLSPIFPFSAIATSDDCRLLRGSCWRWSPASCWERPPRTCWGWPPRYCWGRSPRSCSGWPPRCSSVRCLFGLPIRMAAITH